MKLSIVTKSLQVILLLTSYAECSASVDGILFRETNFISPVTSANVTVKMYLKAEPKTSFATKTLVYIKNLPIPRLGTESDESIVSDYLHNGWLVAEVDYASNSLAVSPNIETELEYLSQSYFAATNSSFWNTMKPIRPERNWIVLAGYRVETDIPFYDVSKYASQDVLNELLWQYNEIVCSNNTTLTRETNALNLKSPNGQPLRWVQSLDIIYPSHPNRKVPHINDNCADMKRTQTKWSIGFMVRGCSFSTTDHNYNPIWLSYYKWLDGYKYHSIDAYCGAHAALAAVRFLYANSDRFNIDTDHIGFLGHSKAQYGVTVISDPNLAVVHEKSYYQDPNCHWPEQPNEAYPTRISVGYQGSGSGAYCPNLITPDYVPTFIGQGALDDNKGNIPQFAVFCKAFEKQHVKHFQGLLMPDIPHSMPKGWNPTLNRDNYSIFVEFMDQYLLANPDWPLVSAGTNQTINAGTEPIQLFGKTTPAGATIKSIRWEKVKGPEVNISDPETLRAKINHPVLGLYLFRLTATDSAGKCGYALVQITVSN